VAYQLGVNFINITGNANNVAGKLALKIDGKFAAWSVGVKGGAAYGQASPAGTAGAEAPVQLGNRLTTTTVEIHGVTIPAGSTLTLCIGAANRDPAVFESPDALKLDRRPNPQLAFGGGIHTCAGLHVARLEAKIALTQLFSRLPRLALAGTPERAQRARFRGFTHLPVTAG
jgi:hypothetical protein